MSGIFNPNVFSTIIFNTGTAGQVVEVVVKTGTGGIDPQRKRKTIYKPTGLLDRPRVQTRIEETRDIHAEVAGRLSREFIEEPNTQTKPIAEMTAAEVDREIGLLMREKIRKEDEDDMMLVMMIAASE